MKLAKVSAKLVANFRRSLEDYFRASSAGKIVRSMFHQNSTVNSTIKLHYEVLGVGGPYNCDMTTLIFSTPPGTLLIPLNGAPGTLSSWPVTETLPGTSRLKTTQARTPKRGTPPHIITKVDVSKVDVKGFPNYAGHSRRYRESSIRQPWQ